MRRRVARKQRDPDRRTLELYGVTSGRTCAGCARIRAYSGDSFFEEDHVEEAVLPALEEDQITGFNRRRDVRGSQLVAEHVVSPNRAPSTSGIVPRR